MHSILQNTSRFWSGLGGSDTDYAWALVCSPLTDLAVIPFAALMTHRSPFSVAIFFSFILMAIGSLIYAVAVNVWMIFIGRALRYFTLSSVDKYCIHKTPSYNVFCGC